jgi:hypothetical protein
MVIYLEPKDFAAAQQAGCFTERWFVKPTAEVGAQAIVHDAGALPCAGGCFRATLIDISSKPDPKSFSGEIWTLSFTCSELTEE